MVNYFSISIVISLIAIGIINYSKGTSSANYYLSLTAIIAWFIPYPFLADLIPKAVLSEPIIVSFSQLTLTKVSSSEPLVYIEYDLWVKWGLSLLVSIGALLFVARLIQSASWKKQLMQDATLTLQRELSTKYQVSVYSVNQVSTGLLLGIVKPVIIISTDIKNSKYLDLIISHEQQHIKNKDNTRLLLLTLGECLFWWNPLVRKLITVNRFYIEARCDEHASKQYGEAGYTEGLAALILLKHHTNNHSQQLSKRQGKENNLFCSAISMVTNNVARIKLLKEKRKMTFKTKLTYAMVALTALTTISWNTLATAYNTERVQHSEADKKQLGALVDFKITISYNREGDPESDSYSEDVRVIEVGIWSHFDEKFNIKVGDEFTVNIKAKDLGELVSLEYDLIEVTPSGEAIISKPKLTVKYGDEATVEIDNPQVSKNAYSIIATPTKTYNPS